MVTCLDCSLLNLQKDRPMAALGFGMCALDGPGVFKSVAVMRDCSRFAMAKEEIRVARGEWMEKRASERNQKAQEHGSFELY